MKSDYKTCPNCGIDVFYINLPGGGLLFFRVDLDNRIIPTKPTDHNLGDLDFSVIYCSGCGWYGRLDELQA